MVDACYAMEFPVAEAIDATQCSGIDVLAYLSDGCHFAVQSLVLCKV